MDAPGEKAWLFAAQSKISTTFMMHSPSGDICTLLETVLYPYFVISTFISNFLFSNAPSAQTSLINHQNPQIVYHLATQRKTEPARKECQKSRQKTSKRKGDRLRTR